MTFIEKKIKKMETENVRKQLKRNQIVFKILSCIENANINIHSHIYSHSFFNYNIIRKSLHEKSN